MICLNGIANVVLVHRTKHVFTTFFFNKNVAKQKTMQWNWQNEAQNTSVNKGVN